MDQIRTNPEELNNTISRDNKKSQNSELKSRRYRLKKFKSILKTKTKKLYFIFTGKIEKNFEFILKKVIVKTYGFPIILIISILSIFLLEILFPMLPSKEDTYKTILTTLSSVSAGILAIIFALLMVVGQLNIRHSPRMFGRIFTKFSLGYMSLFLILVILPLITLSILDGTIVKTMIIEFNLKLFFIKLTFFLNILSLLFLIPYLIYLKNRINPETLLNELSEKFKKEIKRIKRLDNFTEERKKMLLEELNVIQQLIINAIRNGDYSTCSRGITVLSELSNETPSHLMIEEYNENISLPDLIGTRITDIGLTAVKDTLACSEIVKTLRTLEKSASQKNTLIALRLIGDAVIRDGSEKTAKDIAYSYGAVGYNAIKRLEENEISEAISGLRDFSSDLFDNHPDWRDAIQQSINALVFLGVNASKTICSTEDEDDKKKLVGKVRRVVLELRDISSKSSQIGLIELSRDSFYKISTVSREAIQVRVNSTIWPESAIRLAISYISYRTIRDYKQADNNDNDECLIATCKGLQMLAHEAMNTDALRPIVILIIQKLLEIKSRIEQNERNEELIKKINYLINGIRQRGFKLRWGDILLDIKSNSENQTN